MYTLEEKENSQEKKWIFEFLEFGTEISEQKFLNRNPSQELNESNSDFFRKERKNNKPTCHDTYFYFQLHCIGNG